LIFATLATFSGSCWWCEIGDARRDADLRIGHAAVLVSDHEGDDAGEIALKRQHLQSSIRFM
jgi:hypothetical protein